jgi:RimJ/RimL family protein N-acetyltransferase
MTEPPPIPETVHTTRDGRVFRLRQGTREDAAAVLRYAKALFDEPDMPLLYSPGEFSVTLAEQKEFIEKHTSPGNLLLYAFAGEEVIGSLGFQAGTQARTRHAGTFGMAVAKGWRGVGVGSLLLERLISWAKEHPEIERIGLEVFETNLKAVRLYRRFGFQEEGHRRGAIRLDDQRVDSVVMGLLLPPKSPLDPLS